MMRLWDQLGGARPGRPRDDDAWLSQYAEATTWWHRNRRRRQGPNHATPFLDLILPPCAAICLFISSTPCWGSAWTGTAAPGAATC
jgi:hypothetical protein